MGKLRIFFFRGQTHFHCLFEFSKKWFERLKWVNFRFSTRCYPRNRTHLSSNFCSLRFRIMVLQESPHNSYTVHYSIKKHTSTESWDLNPSGLELLENPSNLPLSKIKLGQIWSNSFLQHYRVMVQIFSIQHHSPIEVPQVLSPHSPFFLFQTTSTDQAIK